MRTRILNSVQCFLNKKLQILHKKGFQKNFSKLFWPLCGSLNSRTVLPFYRVQKRPKRYQIVSQRDSNSKGMKKASKHRNCIKNGPRIMPHMHGPRLVHVDCANRNFLHPVCIGGPNKGANPILDPSP